MRHFSESPLLTDLYELTMLQAYFLQGMNDTASFEFFVRALPAQRNFMVAAGLEQAVQYLTRLRFDRDDIAWLRGCGQFDPVFVDSLRDFRFSGDVDALPEGTVFFADEPILRVTAPLREAQFVESRLMNLLHFQTMVASKAARSVMAAQGRRLIDFGLRRAHGAEAALLSARASYIAGFNGSATTAAARFGIPVSGTMAHAFVQAHDYETDAFAAFVRAFPDNATLLIDTYDTEAAACRVVRLAQWLREEEPVAHIKAVRLDSGDLGALAARVRQILDQGDCGEIGIFASGNLDEYAIQSLLAQQAPIDGFGVGTRMNTSADAPYLDCAYKLVEYAGQARRKRSTAKATWPGCKQVYRRRDADGVMEGDVLALRDESLPGEALLQPVLRRGAAAAPMPDLAQIRANAQAQIAALPASSRTLTPADPYPVSLSDALVDLARQVDERQRALADSDQARWGFEDE